MWRAAWGFFPWCAARRDDTAQKATPPRVSCQKAIARGAGREELRVRLASARSGAHRRRARARGTGAHSGATPAGPVEVAAPTTTPTNAAQIQPAHAAKARPERREKGGRAYLGDRDACARAEARRGAADEGGSDGGHDDVEAGVWRDFDIILAHFNVQQSSATIGQTKGLSFAK